MSPSVLLVDGTGLLVRAGHAGRPTGLSASGVPTGQLLFFINSLTRIVRKVEPAYVAVCWDGRRGREWRQAICPEYKASRYEPGHDPWPAEERAMTFCVLSAMQSVTHREFEADDGIAALWRAFRACQPDATIIIASDDGDLHQLLDPGVYQIGLGAGGQTRNVMWVRSKYGCAPRRLPVLRAMMGDPSDGIPGIPGVGPRKALQLLPETSQSITQAMRAWPVLRGPSAPPERIEAYRQVLDLRNPPRKMDDEPDWNAWSVVQACQWSPQTADTRNGAALHEFLEELEFTSVIEKRASGKLWRHIPGSA